MFKGLMRLIVSFTGAVAFISGGVLVVFGEQEAVVEGFLLAIFGVNLILWTDMDELKEEVKSISSGKEFTG